MLYEVITTIFNILGPLSNPAGANRQVVGVFSEDLGEPYARVLAELGQRRSFVVHGTDGMEENYDNYRVANREMADISELLLVHNVTPERNNFV